MKRTTKRLVFILAASLIGSSLLSACAAPPPMPEDSFYRIMPKSVAPGDPILPGVVEINRFTASGSLGNRPLLMSSPDSNAITEYHYHFWIEAPPVLLQNALVSYLRAAKVATRVVTPDIGAIPNYTVMGRVLRLETVRGKKPAGVVTLELSLRRERDGKLLLLSEYTVEIPAAKDRVQDGAKALEQAINDVFAKFVADMRSSTS